MPWLKFNPLKEYRIFVCKNKITAISQQNLYDKNIYLNEFNIEERSNIIKKHVSIITDFFNCKIKNSITHTNSYAIDLVIMENDKPYFIEINSFGKEYASGSSLFHWLIDEDKLYGTDDKIYFRYTV